MKKETNIPNFLLSKQEDDRAIPELYDNLYLTEDSSNEALSELKLIKNKGISNKAMKNKANS